MQVFYTPDIASNTYSLSEEEARHCLKVLRLKKGDEIHLTNGKGNLYKSQITHIDKNSCEVEVIETFQEYGKRNHYLHIAIAPTKNSDRFEWFLEKATEIGIDEITPLICERSVKEKLRFDRLNKIITSAVKQSLKAYHPKLNEALDYKDFMTLSLPIAIGTPLQKGVSVGVPRTSFGQKRWESTKLIAHCYNTTDGYLNQHLAKTVSTPLSEELLLEEKLGRAFLILIGPEGDFTPQEIELALKNEFIPISLGKSRLRTETAGLYACTIINSVNE